MSRLITFAFVLLVASACSLSDFFGPRQQTTDVTVVPVATFAAPNATAGGEVSFLVQRAQETPDDVGQGQKRILLQTVISNLGTVPLTFDAQSFQLADTSGMRYEAVEPETRQLPQLIGAEVPAQSTQVGILRFDVPADRVLSDLTLLWCIEPGCLAPLSAPVALPTGE